MSVWTKRWIECDADLCDALFLGQAGRSNPELSDELRKRARASGWTQLRGSRDLCPDHREVEL